MTNLAEAVGLSIPPLSLVLGAVWPGLLALTVLDLDSVVILKLPLVDSADTKVLF